MGRKKFWRSHYSFFLLIALTACGQAGKQGAPADGENCTGSQCSEKTINAPAPGAGNTPPAAKPDQSSDYRLPAFDPSWGLTRALFEKAQAYYEAHRADIPNQRYVTIADFNLRSSQYRLFLFDLSSGAVEKHFVAHGSGSDPGNSGYATLFSNVADSKMSSLGFYLTLATYQGKHGYSLHLRGLEATNSNAEARDIVMHPADYVSEASGHAGRSWGCPALDPAKSQSIIERVQNGSLLLIDR
jgi:L,D-transpeptidase catalytic domain